MLQPESEQARLRRDGKGRVYGEVCMRHVWCDRSQDLRADPHPSVPSLVCYCILLPNYWPAAYAAQARNLTDPAIGKCIIKPSAATPKKSRSKSAHRPRETKKGAPRTARRRRGNNGRAHEAKPVTQTSHGPPAPDRLLHLDAGQERPEFDRAVFKSVHDAGRGRPRRPAVLRCLHAIDARRL